MAGQEMHTSREPQAAGKGNWSVPPTRKEEGQMAVKRQGLQTVIRPDIVRLKGGNDVTVYVRAPELVIALKGDQDQTTLFLTNGLAVNVERSIKKVATALAFEEEEE